MAKRQREWAKKKHRELIRALGGVCEICGDTNDLTVDHINGRDYALHLLSSDQRVMRYRKELASGVPLRSLCRSCNSRVQRELDLKKAKEYLDNEMPF